MKKLGELWNEYREYTEDFTRHSRKLAAGGTAVCWFFRRPDFTFPSMIYLSLLFFVIYFLLDLAQVFVGAVHRRNAAYQAEEKIREDGASLTNDAPVAVPKQVDAAPFKLFVSKAVVLVFGFCLIAFELLFRLTIRAATQLTATGS